MPFPDQPLIHFETLSDRPRVFRMTEALVSAAKARNKMNTPTSIGRTCAIYHGSRVLSD